MTSHDELLEAITPMYAGTDLYHSPERMLTDWKCTQHRLARSAARQRNTHMTPDQITADLSDLIKDHQYIAGELLGEIKETMRDIGTGRQLINTSYNAGRRTVHLAIVQELKELRNRIITTQEDS